MPGGLVTQNPFNNEWNEMVDEVIQNKYVGKYRVLQVRTQVRHQEHILFIFNILYVL